MALISLRDLIIRFIDFFYKPFQTFVPLETFRYAACGAANTVLDISLFYISYNFILHKQILYLGFIAISPHIAAFIMSFCITFPTGFLLNKYITFMQSELRGVIQLFRYGLTVLVCILLNYVFLKIFVEYFGLYATLSKILTTSLVVIFSYFSQKHYSFKGPKT